MKNTIKVNVERDENMSQVMSVTIDGMSKYMAESVVRNAKISVSKVLKEDVGEAISNILATFNAINFLDSQDTSVKVGDVLYPLADYKLSEGWKRFVQPRKVACSADLRAMNLVVPVKYGCPESAKALTPASFKEALLVVAIAFKRSLEVTDFDWVTSSTEILKDTTIVTNGTFVSHPDCDSNGIVPVFLKNDFLYKRTYFIYDLEEYISNGIFKLMVEWRN